ncbi:MAG: flagellar motor switch protein FliG [Oscillospiraceae bacterium]
MYDKEITNEQKAAIVMVALGSDNASNIYKYLGESDLEKLTLEIARLNNISAAQREETIEDFYRMCVTQKVVTDGGLDYAKDVLEKAFGVNTASTLLERITKSLTVRKFDFIRKTDSKNLYAIIQHERPQTIALILAYARVDQAAAVIAELPPTKQARVVECMAKIDSASPETVKVVESILERKFESVVSVDFAQVGGVDYVADVMNNIDRANEKKIFDELSQINEKLANDIRNKMFVFEDVVKLDDRSIQRVLTDVDAKDLVYALKGSSKDIQDIMFANMSSRRADTVRSDLENTFNVRMRDVDEAQQRIVSYIRELEENGDIVISTGGKDEVIA